MNLSNEIARMLSDMLSETGTAEICRNEFAESVGCAPSQINYVITSRFTPEMGYNVESRRGGGGYIRITRISLDGRQTLMHVVNGIGAALDEGGAAAIISGLAQNDMLTASQERLMKAAVNDKNYAAADRKVADAVRAQILKRMLVSVQSP